MRARYRDGSRSRAVEVTPEGGGAYRVTIDDASLTLSAEALDDGRMRITGPDGVTVVEVTAVGSQRSSVKRAVANAMGPAARAPSRRRCPGS